MLNSFSRFFISQKYYTVSSVLLVAHLIFFMAGLKLDNFTLRFSILITGLFFLIFGTGSAFTIIIQWVLQKKFEFWEFISLALATGLLIPPAILNLEYLFFRHAELWLPIANILVFWILAGILLFLNKTSLPCLPKRMSAKKPFLIILIFGIILTAIQILSYQALPDLDPYKWLFKYHYQFSNHLLDTYERPLFGSLIYITAALTGLDIYSIFKYLLPFLSLSVLFPAWMMARTFESKAKQWLFLVFALTSPATILYAQTSMPQAPFIWLSYFFTFFLLYSTTKKDSSFLYAAGVLIFLASFYHQAALITFIAWLISVIIFKRKALFSSKKILILTVFVLILIFSRFSAISEFVVYWTRRIIPHFFKENSFNWFYPWQYTNIDNQIMGWGSFGGIVKFYAFYAGPAIIFVFLFFVWLLFQKKFRVYIFSQFSNEVSLAALLFSFVVFFIIAEIFPRFPNIALLPDRAWIFAGLAVYVFLFLMLRYTHKITPAILIPAILLFLTGTAGATYINFQKRYLISPMQLESARWIKSNLSDNRLFFSFGHKSLLPIHADTPLVIIPAQIYCQKDIGEYNKTIAKLKRNPKSERGGFIAINPLAHPVKISAPIMNENIYSFNFVPDLDDKLIYIYYSRLHIKNPYRGRSYSMTSWGMEKCPDEKFLFDEYPNKFQRIYEKKDNFDEVIIWKIL